VGVQARIRITGNGVMVAGGTPRELTNSPNEFPAIEWCIDDDCLNVADSAAFTVANIDGENTGAFSPGQLVVIEVRDPNVAGHQWTSAFKGRVKDIVYTSDLTGGSIISVSCMDLGWHLTACCAVPLTSTASGTIDQLISKLVDSSWGLGAAITHGNAKNRQLKQGRLGASLQYIPPLQRQFILIQVEPGQTPWQILSTYAARLGLLINVGVQGDIILFQPDYRQQSPYDSLEYHGSREGARTQNNVSGKPTLKISLDGLYSETQCWTTSVKPILVQANAISQNPNAAYRRYTYKPSPSPIPFTRRGVFVDPEAINSVMGNNRAIWKLQSDAFNAWEYTVEVPTHSSGGVMGLGWAPGVGSTFFASDTMISVNDTVHQVLGSYYVQKVRRSQTLQGGTRTQLTLRKPWLLNPSLQAQVPGSGSTKTNNPSGKAVP
jgi:prophage tail gpP-like protein